jgi:hypothetical protein
MVSAQVGLDHASNIGHQIALLLEVSQSMLCPMLAHPVCPGDRLSAVILGVLERSDRLEVLID